METSVCRLLRNMFASRKLLHCRSFYAKNVKRLYSPRSLSGSEESWNKVPNRMRRRLEKHGFSCPDDEIGPFTADKSTKDSVPPGAVRSPHIDASDFPKSSQELDALIKDMTDTSSEPLPGEQFPSDWSKHRPTQRRQERDQSKKAFRPQIDPSETSLVLFPGQGSQFVGMGKDTLGYGNATELFEEASAVLKYDLLKMCLSGPISTLSKTVHCQLAVLVSSLAAVEKLQEQDPKAVETCVGTAGFSVGEYAALVFARVMSFADAVEVVRIRAEAMQRSSEEVSSGMMTTFLHFDSKLGTAMMAAREYCQQRCNIDQPVCGVANYLYPECKVIAGHTEALDFIDKHKKTFGIRRCKRLPVSGAFHTKLMASAQEPVKEALSKITLNSPQIPVYSNVTASRFNKPPKIAKLLQEQITSPVKWEQTMHVMYSRPQGQGFPFTYEAGPGNQLGVMLKLVNKKAYDKYTQVKV